MASGYRPERRRTAGLSRRRFVGATALLGTAAAAAGLVGCGSNGKNNAGAKPAASTTAGQSATAAAAASSNATRAAAAASPTPSVLDSTKGKPGGTLKYYINAYPGGLTIVDRSFGFHYGGLTQSALLGQRWGQESVAANDSQSLEPDLAQAMPEQPDDQTFVFKLRPGVKFSNGRALTADDVAYSYNRYATYDKSYNKSIWQTWFDHAETPDPQTVVVKSKFPYADSLPAMAANNDGFILAKEHEEGPDAATTMVGSGPYSFVSDQAPLLDAFKKNPDYYLKPYPYFDQIQVFSNSDAQKPIADFASHQVQMPWMLRPDDRDQLKPLRPDAKLQPVEIRGIAIFMRTDKAPFNDKRVRQALSMSIDRDKLWNLTQKGEGRTDQYFNVIYANNLGTHEPKDLGAAAKYWTYDPQGAKQLMAAAGYDKPFDSQMSHWDASNSGQWFPDLATLIQGGWKDLALANVKDNTQLASQFTATTNQGQYDGMGLMVQTGLNGTTLTLFVHDDWFWGPNGEHSAKNLCYANDQPLSALADKQVRQTKLQDRQQSYQAMEQILAEQQYMIVLKNQVVTWFYDPSLQNARMTPETGSRRFAMRWWFA